MTRATRGASLLALALLGCAHPTGEADDVCTAERQPDGVDPDAWTVGVQLPYTDGAVHIEARWADVETPARPVALFLHGSWDPLGTPVTATTLRPELISGIVSLHLDFPGNGRTDGRNDRRGTGSRAAVAAALAWAAGSLADLGGCTLAERVPGADPDGIYVIGTSNGGNLAFASLAHPTVTTPVAGLVVWETPSAPQFTNVELGVDPTVYAAESCGLAVEAGIVCDIPTDQLFAGTLGDEPVVCFDVTGDAACGEGDVNVKGVRDLQTNEVFLSPILAAAAEARGILPGDFASSAAAIEWWAERDASRLAPALVAARPDLPILLLASEIDHVQSLADHPHVFGLGEALQTAGAAWTRLNPGTAWLPTTREENAPNARLKLDDPRGSLLPEEAEAPASTLFAAAVTELADRTASGDW